jgi:hypothetical protein
MILRADRCENLKSEIMTSNLLLFLWDNAAMLSCKRIILFTIQPQTFFPAELDTPVYSLQRLALHLQYF